MRTRWILNPQPQPPPLGYIGASVHCVHDLNHYAIALNEYEFQNIVSQSFQAFTFRKSFFSHQGIQKPRVSTMIFYNVI
jgi:hypothetical protein